MDEQLRITVGHAFRKADSCVTKAMVTVRMAWELEVPVVLEKLNHSPPWVSLEVVKVVVKLSVSSLSLVELSLLKLPISSRSFCCP